MPKSLPISHDQNYDKIVTTYEILHRLFFGLGIFIVIVLIGLYLANTIISKNDLNPTRSLADVYKENFLLSGMIMALHQYDTHPSIKLFIKQGKLVVNPTKIQSNNNLITYKGFVLPRYFSTLSSSSLESMSQFLRTTGSTITTTYNPSKLLDYMNTMIYSTPVYEDGNDKKDIKFMEAKGNLIDYFGVNCLKSDKIINGFCNSMVESMVNVLPIYSLNYDLKTLESLAILVNKTTMSKQFCDSIKQYVYFSNNTSDVIKTILMNCGSGYIDFYNQFSLFISIQDQLTSQFINATVTNNPLLNAYKLISTQQIIHNELQGGKFNEIRIASYNKYVKEILRRPDALDAFYFDVISFFNNQYLVKELNIMMLKGSAQVSKDIKNIIDDLRTINGGDFIEGYEGLAKYSILSGNIDFSNTTLISDVVNDKSLADIFSSQHSFENFIVKDVDQTKEEKKLDISGIFRFFAPASLKGNIEVVLYVISTNDKFLVSSIKMPRYLFLEGNLNKILNNTPYDIPSLYNFISINGASLNTKPKTLCETIKDLDGLISCTDKDIIIVKKTQEIGDIRYSIVHNNGSLISYIISDTTLQKKAMEELGTPSTTESSLFVFIDKLVRYRPTVEVPIQTTATTGLAQIVQVKDDFAVIGANVKNITKVGSLYSVEFLVKDIEFICAYDLSKQTILGMAIIAKGTKYPLKSFVLPLSNEKSSDVIYFAKDPKGFLLQKDPLTVKRVL